MPCKRSIGFAAKAIANQVERKMFELSRLAGHDPLTGIQHGILGYLGERRGEDSVQRDIEHEFHVRRSTAAGVLKQMEKNGLVTREGVEGDARLKKVVLTDKAWRMHRDVDRIIDQVERQATSGIPREEIRTFYRVAEKMLDNLK